MDLAAGGQQPCVSYRSGATRTERSHCGAVRYEDNDNPSGDNLSYFHHDSKRSLSRLVARRRRHLMASPKLSPEAPKPSRPNDVLWS